LSPVAPFRRDASGTLLLAGRPIPELMAEVRAKDPEARAFYAYDLGLLRERARRFVAAFAGLLHMTVHSLTKSAIFFTVGHASQKTGTQNMDDIRGLCAVEDEGVEGVICGRSIYSGDLDFEAAQKLADELNG